MNVYTFITTPHPDEDVIVAVCEYVDTAHAYQTLVPAVLAAAALPGGTPLPQEDSTDTAMGEMLGEAR